MAGCVSAILQVGDSMHSPHSDKSLQLDLYNVTCCQDASWQLSCTEGIFRAKKRNGDGGGTDTLVVSALDLCVCIRAIYEETLASFLQTELLVCHRSCCANINCRGAPAAIVGFTPPPLVSHPASLYTSFVKCIKEDRHTIEEHFSVALALHWCSDTG